MVSTASRFSQLAEGIIYVVEYRDDLRSGGWTELERRLGVGRLEIVNDTAPNLAARFYRVRTL